jgi:hypothetical protein
VHAALAAMGDAAEPQRAPESLYEEARRAQSGERVRVALLSRHAPFTRSRALVHCGVCVALTRAPCTPHARA